MKNSTKNISYTTEEKNLIEQTKSLFIKNEIPEQYFSFYGYKEESLCLEKINENGYITYIGERSNKYDLKSFSTIYDATLSMTKDLAQNKQQEEKMLQEHLVIIKQIKLDTTPDSKILKKL